ncbi:MAG: hypothetical protein H6709_00470 [Kofleriaceae bacterium]|nr:hypothetical protein [Myxococcales bacterium]MCB9558901.1 hypothetical protein [Kofleriaceae bacterium]MCB9570541.1 hypothetical protein [Kofleriaceae bacterium]
MILIAGCGSGGASPPDAGDIDGAPGDVSTSPDAGPDADLDATPPDGMAIDAMPIDAAPIDAAPIDAMPIDAAPIDAAPIDAMPIDATPIDAMPIDAMPTCVVPAFTTGVSTLAGCEIAANVDGARADARFANPVNVARGPDGDLYVADFDNNEVRVVTAAGAVRTLVAQTHFVRPFGIAFTAAGALYVQTDDDDLGAHSGSTGTVWEVDLVTGVATVVVRDVGRPRGLAALADGRLVLSDYVHHTIRLLDPDTGTITDLAGATDLPGYADDVGAAARFDGPYDVAVLPDGRIAVADLFNQRIRAVALDGTVTTLAGTGTPGATDGDALTTATFQYPVGLAVDSAGDLYVTDTGNFVVRKLAAGAVTTVVGDGTGDWLDSDNLLAARLYGLEGADVSADGATLWLADGSRGEALPYNRVRVVDLTGP